MRSLITLFCLLFSGSLASALTISYPEGSKYGDYNQPTHILVAGYANGLGAQFFRIANHRALRYRELYPEHAVIVIGPDQVDLKIPALDNYEGYKKMLKTLRLNVAVMNEEWLLNYRLMEIMLRYKKIASIDIVSHSATHIGAGLEDIPAGDPMYKYKRLNYYTPGVSKLKALLTKDAFIYLHGCNTGFQFAPKLAEILGVPTAGSLTYTNFQELFNDGQWYFNDSGKYPENLGRATSNMVSLKTPQPCSTGVCHRMNPEPYPYSGFWGKLSAGLAHYKFFCGSRAASLTCKKGMARALLANMNPSQVSPGVSVENFKWAAKELLCPDSMRLEKRKACFLAMDQSFEGPAAVPFTGMTRGHTVNCDFKTCDVLVSCTEEAGSCRTTYVGKEEKMLTTGLEYRALIEGFLAL